MVSSTFAITLPFMTVALPWLSLIKTSSALDCFNVAIPEETDDREGTLKFCTELASTIKPFSSDIGQLASITCYSECFSLGYTGYGGKVFKYTEEIKEACEEIKRQGYAYTGKEDCNFNYILCGVDAVNAQIGSFEEYDDTCTSGDTDEPDQCGKSCSDDSDCGGTCRYCSSTNECTNTGVSDQCGKSCSDDSDCGGTCHYCSSTNECTNTGVSDQCGKSCSDDSDCGGFCGYCSSTNECTWELLACGGFCSDDSDCGGVCSYCSSTNECMDEFLACGEFCSDDSDCVGFCSYCNSTNQCTSTLW
jgi:hypothetical protein